MKKWLAVLLTVVTAVGLTACSGGQAKQVEVKPDKQEGQVKSGTVITVGKIMGFEGEFVDILTGDTVERFNFDQAQAKDFYKGQNVELVSDAKTNKLNVILEKDFTKRFTTMGEMITTEVGVVKEKKQDHFVIETLKDKKAVEIQGDVPYKTGTQVRLEYVVREKKNVLTAVYNEDTKMSLTVSEIKRSNEGEMLLTLTDKAGKTYLSETSNASALLNLSEIKAKDSLTVYHEGFSEENESKLETTLIVKTEK